MTPTHTQPLWELDNITKVFPGMHANDGVSMSLYPGEIHGLLGRERIRQINADQNPVGRLPTR